MLFKIESNKIICIQAATNVYVFEWEKRLFD